MKVEELILDRTFDCGQCFRWNKGEEGEWIGVVGSKLYVLRQETDEKGSPTSEINIDEGDVLQRRYLDLDTDYQAMKKELASRDETLKEAMKSGEGIRILRQDLWETLISFIISQNNNIPRIKGCIEKLCLMFGEEVGSYKGKTYYSFPTAERLAGLTLEDLRPVRLGYRDSYILDTAKAVAEEGSIREDVGSYKGVGPKVKACIELFGKHDLAAFPIDVWVKRVMNSYYGIPESDVKAMNGYARDHFYPYGGLAQQYLFYDIREKSKK